MGNVGMESKVESREFASAKGIGDWQEKIGARQMMSYRTDQRRHLPPPAIYLCQESVASERGA